MQCMCRAKPAKYCAFVLRTILLHPIMIHRKWKLRNIPCRILLFGDDVTMEFNRSEAAFKGTKKGRIYLTTHRMIFNSKKKDPMMSFSFPFVALKMVFIFCCILINKIETQLLFIFLLQVKLKQPVFGANYIEGVVEAQPNGNWNGEAKFKLMFNVGGAIDFCEAMFKATKLGKNSILINHYIKSLV